MKNNYYTFGMIKLNGVKNIRQILKMIYDAGLKIEYYECDVLTEQLFDENYGNFMCSTDYSLLKKNLLNGPTHKRFVDDKINNILKHCDDYSKKNELICKDISQKIAI